MRILILIVGIFAFSFQSEVTITKDELLGKFDPSTHPDFKQIASSYTAKPNIYLRSEVYEAFEKMHKAAKEEGVDLTIISATRSFDHQKSIWNRKWQRSKYMGWEKIEKIKDITLYSSMPGTSRHHWGTDIDLNNLTNDYFVNDKKGVATYVWLLNHAKDYGFCQVYDSKDSGRTGYQEEKWHWSYLPLSSVYLREYNKMISSENISGFDGSELNGQFKAIERYVNGINECQ